MNKKPTLKELHIHNPMPLFTSWSCSTNVFHLLKWPFSSRLPPCWTKTLLSFHLHNVILLIGPKRWPSSLYNSSSTHSSLGFVLHIGPYSLGLFKIVKYFRYRPVFWAQVCGLGQCDSLGQYSQAHQVPKNKGQ
jgi:hypothetical protein